MTCQDCDEPIPAKRLAAKPDALYCVVCQQAHDELLLAVPAVPLKPDEVDAADFAIVPAKAARMKVVLEGVPR